MGLSKVEVEVEVEGPALEQPASSGMLTGGILNHSQGSKIFHLLRKQYIALFGNVRKYRDIF